MIDGRSRLEVQRVCTHVLARERHARTGRIGLHWTGRGIGTDRLWLDADGVHRHDATEAGLAAAAHRLTTLHDLTAWAGVELDPTFSVGHDTPPIGDPHAPLAIEQASLHELLDLFEWAWPVLEEVAEDAPITLWPEHFDAAFTWGEKANIGISPGDDSSPTPYLYVGPWAENRPGEVSYWNAPFGATLPAPVSKEEAIAFINEGLTRLGNP